MKRSKLGRPRRPTAKGAVHRYRVTVQTPWIIDGHPGLELDDDGRPRITWIGGHAVTLQPGEVVEIAEREVPSLAHKLEALDAVGQAVLARAREQLNAPATITLVADLTHEAKQAFNEGVEDALRRAGQFIDLVGHLLARGITPSPADMDKAVREAIQDQKPLPPPILTALADHWAGRLKGKPGPPMKWGHRERFGLKLIYGLLFEEERRTRAERGAPRRGAKQAAKDRLADLLKIQDIKTLERLLRPLRLTRG